MQVKNELWPGILQDFFPMLFKEILITGYIFLREPYLLKWWWKMMKQMPYAFKKRKEIMKRKRVEWKDIRSFVSGKQSQYLKYDLEHPEH
jgi:hypothetical protein